MSHDAGPQNHHDPDESVDETTVPLMLLGGLCLAAFFTLSGDPGPPAGHHGHGMTDADAAAEYRAEEADGAEDAEEREAASPEPEEMSEHDGPAQAVPERTEAAEGHDAGAPDDDIDE